MYGKKRSFKMTRLTKPAKKGDTTITVGTKLDLVKGDKIALAATAFTYDAGE
jgi:ribosomal protein L18E